MSKHKPKPADMSLPPEQRRRPRRTRVVATPPAQMGHANSPRARAHRRDGERWLAREEALREDAEVYVLDLKTEQGASTFARLLSEAARRAGA